MFEKTISFQGTFEALLRRCELLEAKLKSNDVRVPGSSRLGNYRRILERVQRNEDSLTASDLRLVHQALFECSQLLLIVEELAREPEVQGWRPKVREIISGHDLPETEGAHTPGRNTQHELYVAGVCRRAGYNVTLREPDVVIETPEGPLGLAAKRVKSLQQLTGALKSASDQLKRADLVGFPALELTVPLASQNIPWVAENLVKAKEIGSAVLSNFVQAKRWAMRESVDYNRAFGLVLSSTGLFVLTDQGMPSAVTVFRAVNLCSKHDLRRNQAIESFAKSLSEIELE